MHVRECSLNGVLNLDISLKQCKMVPYLEYLNFFFLGRYVIIKDTFHFSSDILNSVDYCGSYVTPRIP